MPVPYKKSERKGAEEAKITAAAGSSFFARSLPSLALLLILPAILLTAGCTPFISRSFPVASPQAEVVEKVLAKHRQKTGGKSAAERRSKSSASVISQQNGAESKSKPPFSRVKSFVSSQNVDHNCSWFYFLWGSQAEYDKRYAEAYDSYEKALACDPETLYIEEKLPFLLLKMKKRDEAVLWLKNALTQNPKNRTYLALLAGIYLQQERIDEAVALYKQLIVLAPDKDTTTAKLAVIYLQQKKYDLAVSLLTSHLNRYPQALLPRLTLARIYALQKKLTPAIAEYRTTLQYHKGNKECANELALVYQLTGQKRQAEKLYRTILADDKQDEKTAYALISMLSEDKRYDDALTELDRLRLFSNNTDKIDYAKSRILLSGNKEEQAKSLLKNLVQSEMHNEACYLLGKISYLEKKPKEAVQFLKQVENGAEPFPSAAFILAKIKLEEGDKEGMVKYLRKCIADKENDSPLFHLMLSSFFIEEKQEKDALDALINGLERYPANTKLLYNYAVLHDKQGHRQKAVQTMEKIITINPEHANALNFLGYTWADHNENLDKAYLYLQKAVRLKPKNGFILDSMGWVLFRMKKYGKAVTTLIRAQLLIPENSLVSEHIGDVYQAMGSSSKAQKWYRDALGKAESEKDKIRIEEKLNGKKERKTNDKSKNKNGGEGERTSCRLLKKSSRACERGKKTVGVVFSTTMFLFFLLLILSLLPLLSGCGDKSIPVTPPETANQEPPVIPSEAVQALDRMVERDRSCPSSFTADLDLCYTSPLKNEAASGYLQFSQPSNYKFSITNPLGQPVWMLAGNDKQFQLLDIVHKKYTAGKLLGYIVRNRLPTFLAEGDWGEWVTGRNFTGGSRIIRVDNDLSGRGIWITLPTKTAHAPYTQLLLDEEMNTLLERVFLDQNGKKLAVISYQMPQAVEQTTVGQCRQPEYIRLKGLGYGSTIELHFSQVEFSQESKSYSVPKPTKEYLIQFKP